ncbi:MAG: helix-turn-helix transcriptional regulator [Coprobacillus sp.]|nr:helix-turn-helix transcriptional regulator [Coprobacillus sp.]
MNIGNRIKQLRIKNKVTQEELAKALQVSTQAVSKWENGGSPDLELVPSIALYFNVTTDYLFNMAENNVFDIEKKLVKYMHSFKLKDRMKALYDLAFKMSIATRGDEIENQEKFNELIKNDDMFSSIIGPEGIAITSLAKDNKIFMCFPKDDISDYSKMLLSKDSQRKFCEYLSDELFYNTLVLLYSRNGGNFTEQLLINNLNITYDEAKSVLQKMNDFNIVECSDILINDTTMKLYKVLQNPQIVGLISMLDMIVNRPRNYCYYYGGPTNYFKHKL